MYRHWQDVFCKPHFEAAPSRTAEEAVISFAREVFPNSGPMARLNVCDSYGYPYAVALSSAGDESEQKAAERRLYLEEDDGLWAVVAFSKLVPPDRLVPNEAVDDRTGKPRKKCFAS
jgi:hypothetical protein